MCPELVMTSRKSVARLAFGPLLAVLSSFLLLPPQFAGETVPKKFSKRADAKLAARKKQIQQELESLKDDSWAGHYYYGDGLGVNVELDLAPKSGFAFTWNGCLGLYDMNYGHVVEPGGGTIRLVPQLPNERKPFESIALEFLPIMWGDRHYLIATNEVVKFANAINAGFEPREGSWGMFLLKREDVSKSATGSPGLPQEYSEYLLKHSVEAEISSIKNSITKKSERLTTVVLNVGAAQGVKKGMEFYLYAPSGLYASATVTAVNDSSSEAEISECCGYEKYSPPCCRLETLNMRRTRLSQRR
jgi:hypothetical protein